MLLTYHDSCLQLLFSSAIKRSDREKSNYANRSGSGYLNYQSRRHYKRFLAVRPLGNTQANVYKPSFVAEETKNIRDSNTATIPQTGSYSTTSTLVTIYQPEQGPSGDNLTRDFKLAELMKQRAQLRHATFTKLCGYLTSAELWHHSLQDRIKDVVNGWRCRLSFLPTQNPVAVPATRRWSPNTNICWCYRSDWSEYPTFCRQDNRMVGRRVASSSRPEHKSWSVPTHSNTSPWRLSDYHMWSGICQWWLSSILPGFENTHHINRSARASNEWGNSARKSSASVLFITVSLVQ